MGWEGGIAAIAVSVALASCGSGGSTADPVQDHVCGEIGAICDQTSITLQAPNDAWASGTYTLALNMDGTPAQCSVQIPDPPPTNGLQGNCTQNSLLTFRLLTVVFCPPVVCMNGACGGSCTPIPGRFQMNLGIAGMPAQVGVDLTVDGTELINETIAPTQTTTQPNGVGCGTCTNASATLSIAGG